ncbi:MAG: hypothetical protein QXF12_00085 [Candidatus Aenigmatarchaeota archaeon]
MRYNRNTEEIVRRFFSSPRARKALLKGSSNNKSLAEKRFKEYVKMVDKISSFYSNMKFFSVNAGTGLSNFPHMGTTVSLAALMAMVRSIAGFTTIEKAIEQPNVTLYFLDLMSVTGGARYPVVGPFDYTGNTIAPVRGRQSASFSTSPPPIFTISIGPNPLSTADIVIDTNALVPPASGQLPAVLPRSFKLTVKLYNNNGALIEEGTLMDDGNGRFLVPSNMLGGNFGFDPNSTISYGSATLPNPLPFTATINFNSISTSAARVDVEYSWSYAPAEQVSYPLPGNETRLKLDLTRTVIVNTKPNVQAAEIDLFTINTMRKTMNTDIVELLTQRISEILIDLMNRYIADVYVSKIIPQKGILEIDLSTPVGASTPTVSHYNAYNPIVDKIMGELESVNHKLAKDSFIGLTANAYMVSSRMAYWLARTGIIDPANYVREDSRFINGLVGYYRGVPVVVNVRLDHIFDQTIQNTNTHLDGLHTAGGFAIHNLPDNDLSPAVYATFLPVTATPSVGNFNNPVQQVLGLYHQADVAPLAPELCVPFRMIGLPPVSVV